MTHKVTLTNLANLQNETTAVNAINANNAAITTAMDNTLSRDGTSPNQMGATIDMNSNRIINLPQAISNQEPMRLQDLLLFLGNGLTLSPLPVGGTIGQTIVKLSSVDYDVAWATSLTSTNRITLTNTPTYDLSTNSLGTSLIVPLNASPQTVAASKNYDYIRIGQLDGSNSLFSLGNLSEVAGISGYLTANAGSGSTSVIYGGAFSLTNAGAGSVKPIHAFAQGSGTSTGVLISVNAQISPVATSGYSSALFTSLTSSGINNLALGLGIESNGDQYAYGVFGGSVSPLPIGTAFIAWRNATASSAGAQFLRLLDNSGNNIFFVNKTGALQSGLGGTQAGSIAIAGSASGQTTLVAASAASGSLTIPSATDTLIGKATTDTLTNKTFDSGGTGNVLKIAGSGTISGLSGSSTVLLTDTSPSIATQVTVPKIIGGSGTTGTILTLQTTSGTGTTDALTIVGGTAGGTTFATFNAVKLNIPTGTAASSTSTGALTITGGLGVTGNIYASSATFIAPNVAFELRGSKTSPGVGNIWDFQTVDSDGRIRLFDGTNGLELWSLAQNTAGSVTQAGSLIFSTATKTIVLKQGANGTCGTFVCNGATPVTVTNSNVAITDTIIISLNTAGGTVGGTAKVTPMVTAITGATSFVTTGQATDTSTYNYAIIKNAA